MSFAWHLQSILKELQIKDIDRSRYTSCADEIRNYLMNALQKTDHDFKDAFDGHSLTGSYLDGVKLKTPDEFDIHIKLKFPFPLKPIKDNNHAGFVLLQTSYGGYHPLIENNYLNHDRLQTWLRGAFTKVLKGECRSIQVENECFILEYKNQGYGCAHTIVATSRARQISFDFVPALEFSYEYWPLATPPVTKEVRRAWPWFAIPQSKKPDDNRTFMVCAPHWEREMMKGKYNLKNILRLMKAVRDVHKDELPHLSSYMLKTVILLELNNADSQLWQEDVGKTIISMWTKLQHYFNIANLPFFLASDCNHFDRMSPREFNTCRKKVDELLTQLTYVSNSPFTDQRVRQLFLD